MPTPDSPAPSAPSATAPPPAPWKWWKKALLGSAVWVALAIGAGILHTGVFLHDRITPEQDSKISEAYGMVCGFGVGLIWALAWMRVRRRRG
jgi:membrane protease YdiL (CAAX protease family)